MATALVKSTTLKEQELNGAIDRAADALEKFRQGLQQKLPSLPNETALGRDAYVFFLKNVALMPYSPEDLLAMGKQEWNRAVAFEAFEKNRNKDVPPLKIAGNIDNWIKEAAEKELQIRKFLEQHSLATLDRFDLVDVTGRGTSVALLLKAIRTIPPLRFAGHVLSPSTILVGHKRA